MRNGCLLLAVRAKEEAYAMRRIVSQEEVEALLCGLGVAESRIADEMRAETETSDAAILPSRVQKIDPIWTQLLLHQVESLEVEVRIELGNAALDAATLRCLQIGELIVLDQTRHSEALVKIEGIPKFKGRPSQVGHHKALEITALLAAVDELTAQAERLVVEFGRTRLLVQDVLRLGRGSVLELYGQIAAPLDVRVRNALVARGDITVVDGRLGVRMTHVFHEVRNVLLHTISTVHSMG